MGNPEFDGSGGMSGHEADPPPPEPPDTTTPRIAPSRPLADEKHATAIYVARNRVNTVNSLPLGFAWFSA